MTPLQRITDAITGSPATAPDINDVKTVLEQYPYFTLPAAICLRDRNVGDDPDVKTALLRSVALTASDPGKLYILLENDMAAHASFYPPEKPATVSTENAIDTFLSTYGSVTPEEDELLNRLIFNPTPDYSQLLAREEEENLPDLAEAPAGSREDRLNQFILKQKQEAGVIPTAQTPVAERAADRIADDPPEPTPDNSLLSESLAKIFIRQRNYQSAYEIISQLSLNYPEKSVYFADQMRFLRKVIRNRRLRAGG